MTSADERDGSTEVGERLRRELFQAREINAEYHIHVVLDPNHPVAPFDSLHPDHLRARVPSVKTQRVDRPDLQHEPDVCPLVVTLFTPGDRGYRDEALLQETVENALSRCASVNGAYVCGWVATPWDGEELAKRIAASTVISHPLTGRRVLPWFEPHRLALLEARHPSVARQLLSEIPSWWFVDMAQELRRVVQTIGAQGESANDSPSSARPVFSQQIHAVWAEQDRIREARLVAMAMRKAEIPLPVLPEAAFDGAVRMAHEYGLRGDQDVVFFAMNSLTLSAGWVEHPVVQAALKEIASSEELTLADMLASQPDAVLDEIASYKSTGRTPT